MSAREELSYEFGPFRLDTAESLLWRDGELLPLTPKAFDTLRLLVENSGRVVSKERLLEAVWPESFVEENVLAVNVSTLRRVLGMQANNQPYIENIPKRGYRFIARVKEVRAGAAGLAGNHNAALDRKDKTVPAPALTSLAVLPLVNASADPNVEYLSDGITESIINSLAQLRQLRVMARSTVFHYKGRTVNPQQIGRELNVQAVLTGQLLQLGSNLIIRTELVDVADGRQLWGAQFNRHLSDILAVQEQISREISVNLRLQLSGAQQQLLTKQHTTNSAAYNCYLLGRYHWNKRTLAGLKEGIKHFEDARALDRSFALALAGLADSYALLGAVEYGALPPREAMSKAGEFALQALKLDDTLAEAHASLAYVNIFNWDWAAAEQGYLRAIELDPNYPTAHHWYGHYLTAMGRQTEALAELTHARKLEPLSLPINAGLGWHFYLTRQYEAAIVEYRKTLDMEQNFYLGRFLLGMAYAQIANYDAALAEYQRANDLVGSTPPLLTGMGHAYAKLGQPERAQQVISELQQLAQQRYVSPYYIAVIYAALGDQTQAFAWLHRACDNQSEGLIWAALDPLLDNIRTEPQFADILRRVRLVV